MDMANCVNELSSHIPVDFVINGANQDFATKCLVEYSFLKELLPSIYKEIIVATRAYVIVKPKINIGKKENILFKYEFEIPRTEEVWEETNPITGNPIKIIIRQEKQILDTKTTNSLIRVYVYRVYTLEGCLTYFHLYG